MCTYVCCRYTHASVYCIIVDCDGGNLGNAIGGECLEMCS